MPKKQSASRPPDRQAPASPVADGLAGYAEGAAGLGQDDPVPDDALGGGQRGAVGPQRYPLVLRQALVDDLRGRSPVAAAAGPDVRLARLLAVHREPGPGQHDSDRE